MEIVNSFARVPSCKDAEPAVVFEHVVKDYNRGRALDGVSFSVARGATFGLVGGNGAGKTTTILMVMGLIAPTRGRVTVLGSDATRAPHRVLARMNFASPYMSLPARLTVRQNLVVFARLYGLCDVAGRMADVAHEFDLGDILDRAVGSLSAGQKMRVSLAKAWLNEPDLLLLDEPTSSLAPEAVGWAHERIEARRRVGATILLSSHNMAEVERLCDHVLVMRRGRILAQGAPAELRRLGACASFAESVWSIQQNFEDLAETRRDAPAVHAGSFRRALSATARIAALLRPSSGFRPDGIGQG